VGIAISLIFATALVLPGILFNYYLRKGTWKSPVVLQSFQNELAKGVLYSIALHLLLLWLVDFFCIIRYDLFFEIMFGSYSNLNEAEMKVIYSSVYQILWYFLLSYLFAIGAGIGAFKLIRKTHLDLIFQNNQFSNEWHYYFSGESRVFGIVNPTRKLVKEFLSTQIDGVYISFTLDKNSDTYLYWGLLYEYYFDKKGKLDKIVLTDVARRKLTDDKKENEEEMENVEDSDDDNVSLNQVDTRFYPIRGEYMIFDYSEIKDLNIEYVILEER